MNAPVTYRAFRVWQRDRDAFLRTWLPSLSGIAVEPLFILTVVGFGLGLYVDLESIGDRSYAEFVAPGIIASYAMFHASFECIYGSYMRMETYRIFDSILATPVSVEELVVGEMAWGATRSVMTSTAVLVIAFAMGLVGAPTVILLIPLSFLIGFVFSALALCVTAVAPSINTLENFFTLFITPMFFFSGTFFPLDLLPGAAQGLAWALPLTAATHLSRALFFGEGSLSMLGALMVLVGYIAVFAPLAVVVMRRRLVK